MKYLQDLYTLQLFLGVEIKYFKGGIHLSQDKYAAELLAKTKMILIDVSVDHQLDDTILQ